MTSRRRNSIVIGVTFVIVGAVYAAFAPVFGYHIEWAGVTMLGALGVALGIMAYVLTSGSSD
jgi:uncharacterized membrane protein